MERNNSGDSIGTKIIEIIQSQEDSIAMKSHGAVDDCWKIVAGISDVSMEKP